MKDEKTKLNATTIVNVKAGDLSKGDILASGATILSTPQLVDTFAKSPKVAFQILYHNSGKTKRAVWNKNTLVGVSRIVAVEVAVSHPNSSPELLTKQDVWGWHDPDTDKLRSNGMIVGRSGQVCPIWKDQIPYKSVTVVCEENQLNDVTYWLEFVHGAGSVSNITKTAEGKFAIRSDYQCW